MPVAAAEQAAGMETSADPPFSSSELSSAVVRLNRERDLSSRKKILQEICCRASDSSAALRTVGEALTTCWGDLRYSGSDLSEWQTCVIQAAGGPTKKAKGMPEIFILFVELAVKGGKWCAQATSIAFQESFSQRDSLAEVTEIQHVVIRLASTVLDVAAESYLSGQSPLFEEPLASALENLISNSFELVRLIYVSVMRNASDDDSTRKRCQEFLNVVSRVVHIFRRQVAGMLPEKSNNSQEESSPGSRWPHLPTALRVVASSIQNFAELGKLSTSSGEISFALLNISWKSILAVLQVDEGRDAVASVVDIPSIVATLISNAVQSTKRAIEAWNVKSSSSGQKEARKLCIPIKFFLMTALKISSFYTQKAVMANRYMIACASKVYACLVQKDIIAHKAATESFAELVVPTAFALLQNLLNDKGVREDQKIQILRDITMDSDELEISQAITDLDGCHEGNDIVDELFCNKPALRPGAGLLKMGRVMLFVSILRASCSYSKALLSELRTKLQWLLEEVPEEGMYVLMSQTVYLPVDRSDMSGKWQWQLLFPWVSHAIQVFAVVAAKQEPIWTDFKYFLFDQVLHPSEICRELVLNVWCFVIRESDPQLAQDHVNSLLSILRELITLEEEETLQRRLARTVCVLLQTAPDSVASQVCNADPFKSEVGANMITQLLQEGLSLNKPGSDRLLSCCIDCAKNLVNSLSRESPDRYPLRSIQKPALVCLHLLLSHSAGRGECIEDKYLEEIKQIVRNLISIYTLDHKNSRMFHDVGVIGPTLGLIPHVQHLLDPAGFEALLPRLLEICLTTAESFENQELKQTLPEFLANLSEVAIKEDENNPTMKALWGLYHLVLREKSWALIHMGLQSFAHFAAHSSCQELWRFVPPDAAVNRSGDFMTALKVFIEKECAFLSLITSGEEVQLLRTESNLQQQQQKKILAALKKRKDVEADIGIQQSTKLGTQPTSDKCEIQEAVAMLCKGIGVLKERAPEMLEGEASREWETLRARLADMNEQIKARQRRDGRL